MAKGKKKVKEKWCSECFKKIEGDYFLQRKIFYICLTCKSKLEEKSNENNELIFHGMGRVIVRNTDKLKKLLEND